MLMMLLQAGPIFGQVNRQPQQAQGPDAGTMAGIFICYGVIIVVSIVIHILFLLNLSKCLAQCSPRNRTMEPGQVWLNLIPFFGIVWMFITFSRISESLQNEYRARRLRSDDPEFGKMTGILYMVLSLVGCGPIGLIFFIMYWMKISGYKKQLMSNRGRGGGSGYEDEEEDRPRRGRGRRDAVDDDEDEDEEDDRPRRRRDED